MAPSSIEPKVCVAVSYGYHAEILSADLETHTPHSATVNVASPKELTNGANIMDPAKIRCPTVQAVNKLGFLMCWTTEAML